MTDPRSQWKWAAKKANLLKDPWRGLGFERLQEMIVQRHVYNPRTKKWWKDDISIKMEEKPFAKGAMRRCYRMKKLSKFSHQPDWDHASNYVAKCYIQEQPRSVYEQDVQLQMDSKLWGEKYSRKDPPKKVDFCQAYLIEVQSSNGNNGLYCVEHFIDGEYVKYNSNSGFVNDINRLTPQAFSHFTFEDSGHQCIVVDIQGVGDLYTDPQMHTLDFTEYGEANLGTRGMALFFSSHLCSPLCSTLGLTQFDLSPQEIDRLKSQEWRVTSSKTIVSPSNTCDEKKPLPQSSAECVVESISEAFQRIELTLDLSSHDHKSFIESPLLTPKDLPLSNFLAVEAMEGKDNDIKDNDIHVNDQEDVSKSKIQRYRSIGRSASVVKETGLAEDIEQVKHKLQTLGQLMYSFKNEDIPEPNP